jgi:DNA-directed RNA polymerase subunit RPC12/RpoP
MANPLLALDCPKCGAQLGSPESDGGGYVCAHCGGRSRPKVEVQVQHVVGPRPFNVVATQREIDERKREFEKYSTRDQAARDQRARRAAESRATGRKVAIVVGSVIVALFVAIAAVTLWTFLASRGAS